MPPRRSDPARQTLVARGPYRRDGGGRVAFHLHPGAWLFAPGHVPKLQRLGRPSHARASNGTLAIGVSDLELRLPGTHSASGQVLRPAADAPPPGAIPAR